MVRNQASTKSTDITAAAIIEGRVYEVPPRWPGLDRATFINKIENCLAAAWNQFDRESLTTSNFLPVCHDLCGVVSEYVGLLMGIGGAHRQSRDKTDFGRGLSIRRPQIQRQLWSKLYTRHACHKAIHSIVSLIILAFPLVKPFIPMVFWSVHYIAVLGNVKAWFACLSFSDKQI